MNEKEKEAIEQEFQIALDNIVSKIKGETATAIVYSEQSMILLFRKLMYKIERQQEKLQEKDKIIDNAIIRIEDLRQYFADDCQADFIGILEILKNKSVIDW